MKSILDNGVVHQHLGASNSAPQSAFFPLACCASLSRNTLCRPGGRPPLRVNRPCKGPGLRAAHGVAAFFLESFGGDTLYFPQRLSAAHGYFHALRSAVSSAWRKVMSVPRKPPRPCAKPLPK